jgi:hypothetical protein
VPSLRDLSNTTKIYNFAGDPRMLPVDVWQVDFGGKLDHNALSEGRRRPLLMPRRARVATFYMNPGNRSVTPDFPCISGEWYTFEFAVSPDSTDFGMVELRQDQALPALGII